MKITQCILGNAFLTLIMYNILLMIDYIFVEVNNSVELINFIISLIIINLLFKITPSSSKNIFSFKVDFRHF